MIITNKHISMKDDELLAKLSAEAIAILQAAITPRIETSDITISSIDDGVIVTTTAAGVYRQQGPGWSAALTELWEHALITNREERGRRELSKISYTLLGLVKFDVTEQGRKLAAKVQRIVIRLGRQRL